MKRYDPAPILAGLKAFQRATVDHVTDRFYEDGAKRFLVADETGLGKSVVARGVVARAAEYLQDDPTVNRVDVVYICSNQDIANQNLARLDIGEGNVTSLASRLTLMAKHSSQLAGATATAGKPLNLVAFTPGTSFDQGWRTGKAEERAMLYLLMEPELRLHGWAARSALQTLRATMSIKAFENTVARLRIELPEGPDPAIAREFVRMARHEGLLTEFSELLDEVGRRRVLSPELAERARTLTGKLRATLAKASVATLEPDLIILDEFQRFRHLLAVDERSDAAELAQHMFDYPQAKVLLLSATPYKPYTLAEEAATGEDHYRDFLDLLRFLHQDPEWHGELRHQLQRYRNAAISGGDGTQSADAVRRLLLQVMCRTERPTERRSDMLTEHASTVSPVPADLLGYHALRTLAAELHGPATVEYWKSAPYFVNFMEDYQLGGSLRTALNDGARTAELAPLIDKTQRIDSDRLRRFAPVDLGNARLRELARQTVGGGQGELLWIPPSLPYYRLSEPFADAAAAGVTKRLMFSSWTATPTAVAALLSYEAERQALGGVLPANTAESRRRFATRLEYRLDTQRRAAAMSTLALFWPHPALARACDPLVAARQRPEQLLDHDALGARLQRALADAAPADLLDPRDTSDPIPWSAYLQWPGALPDELAGHDRWIREVLAGQAVATDGNPDALRGLAAHVDQALDVRHRRPITGSPTRVLAELAALGTHAPGNVAWRALGRLFGTGHRVTPTGHWLAAAELASGMRALFNRLESAALLGRLWESTPYWRAVLRYSAAGCLQATLDEYLHHLHQNQASVGVLDDAGLLGLARAAGSVMAMRPSVYRAFDPGAPGTPIGFTSRFALRYGTRSREQESARPSEVRDAFNSPFWPFVLTTTSAGQEGIDFHWWCHAVVHWDIPANPVDFEQREGRVHRYGGHVIRRNIAAAHRSAILAASGTDPWNDAYRIAAASDTGLGEFSPYWVYPGPHSVQRSLLPYPLSRDGTRIEQLKSALALYRLTFGQPRQEDMLDLIQRHSATAEHQARIDLRPESNLSR